MVRQPDLPLTLNNKFAIGLLGEIYFPLFECKDVSFKRPTTKRLVSRAITES